MTHVKPVDAKVTDSGIGPDKGVAVRVSSGTGTVGLFAVITVFCVAVPPYRAVAVTTTL